MANQYGIWISWNNQQEGFELPVLPPELGANIRSDGAEHDVYGLGKINVIKDRGLATYTIESIFPVSWRDGSGRILPPYISASIVLEPRAYVDYIMRWWETKRPVRLVAVTSTMEVNTAASIEGFEWREVAGSPGDIMYSLQLKEYRFYGAKKLQTIREEERIVRVASAPSPTRPDDRVQPKSYTLAAGDNLWKVAQKILGDGSRWREIQTLNNISDAEVKRLPVGKVLKLP